MRPSRQPKATKPYLGHRGTTYKDIFTRWQKLTADKLADAIYEVVRGNTKRLLAQPTSAQSIWGLIVKTLGFPNTKLERLWAHSAFDNNNGNVKASAMFL